MFERTFLLKANPEAWSIAHGLAMLMLNGQIPPDDALIDNVVSG